MKKMRIAAGLIFAGAVSLCASGLAWPQTPATKGPAPPQAGRPGGVPGLVHTHSVRKTLADEFPNGLFFPIGKHATYYPDILKEVLAAGHTVGSHTWSHADLQAAMKKGGPDAAKEEIEKGASAVHLMSGAQIAPFFRFPDL